MALATTTNSGTQNATGTPQTAGQPSLNAASTGSVQPGTANNLLTSQGGIPLGGTALTNVSLNVAQTQHVSTGRSDKPAPAHHNLWGVSVILLVVAAVLLWSIASPVKSTTE